MLSHCGYLFCMRGGQSSGKRGVAVLTSTSNILALTAQFPEGDNQPLALLCCKMAGQANSSGLIPISSAALLHKIDTNYKYRSSFSKSQTSHSSIHQF